MKRLKLSILLCVMLLIASLILTGCSVAATGGENGDNGGEVSGGSASPEGEGSPEEIGGDEGAGDDEPTGGDTIINENITNNEITINGASSDTAYAAAKGLRSAVSIYCTFERTTYTGSYWNPTPSTESYYTTGSGVVYRIYDDGSAFIVTNYHVVYDADSNSENGVSDKIYIYLYGMESESCAIPATFVGGSANYDIAVLRVDASEVLLSAYNSGSCAAVTIGSSDMLTPGASALAIGNPSSSSIGGISVTRGIVSVDSEYITMSASDNSGEVSFRVIRIDAAVNSGNSGGGLFDESGSLIGIVNAKVSSSSIESIGYAIPVSVARGVADNIIDNCYLTECERVMRVTLGIGLGVSEYKTEYDTQTGLLYKREAVMVSSVSEGSVAEGKLAVGDVLLSVTVGERTTNVSRVYHAIDAMLDVRVGDIITLEVLRDGQTITVEIEATESSFVAY